MLSVWMSQDMLWWTEMAVPSLVLPCMTETYHGEHTSITTMDITCCMQLEMSNGGWMCSTVWMMLNHTVEHYVLGAE